MLLQLGSGSAALMRIRTDPIYVFNQQAVAWFPQSLVPLDRQPPVAGPLVAGAVKNPGTSARQRCQPELQHRPFVSQRHRSEHASALGATDLPSLAP